MGTAGPTAAEHASRASAGRARPVPHRLAVRHHEMDTRGRLHGIVAGRSVDDCGGVEDDDVGGSAGAHDATIREAEAGGGEARHPVHRGLEREEPDPARGRGTIAREPIAAAGLADGDQRGRAWTARRSDARRAMQGRYSIANPDVERPAPARVARVSRTERTPPARGPSPRRLVPPQAPRARRSRRRRKRASSPLPPGTFAAVP